MRALSPTVRATSGDARRTGALRRPCRTHPWVARSPRGIELSRALAAADEADGEVGGHGAAAAEKRKWSPGEVRGEVGDALVQVGG